MRSALAIARVGLLYRCRHGRWPSLADPRKFTEWVQWRKLNDRDPDRARLTDKSFSKRMAATVLGEGFVVPSLWEGRWLPKCPPWAMPFIVKANHGCGQWVVVRTAADYCRVQLLAPQWMRRRYGAWLDEWHYRGAARSIIVEPFIGRDGALPTDYKIYVFGGRASMVQVHDKRDADHRWSQYDSRWAPLSRNAHRATKPASLAAMIDAAEQLGRGQDFLRVDFYEVDGQPLFGEFCLYPGSGLDPFDPPTIDDWLGALWSGERCKQPPLSAIGSLASSRPA
jgi:hypothetical protein